MLVLFILSPLERESTHSSNKANLWSVCRHLVHLVNPSAYMYEKGSVFFFWTINPLSFVNAM